MDESNLKEVKAEVRYHMRSHSLVSQKCAFFGTDCDEIQIVPVPVHAGYEEETMACDLYHCFYVNPCHNCVFWFEDFTINVGFWPRNTKYALKYIIFYGNGYTPHTRRQIGSGTNYLIRGLKGGRELKIMGHVLVVKTDQNGFVEEVKCKDLDTISGIVVHVLWERQFKMIPDFWAETV
ncbi:hypothetical protein BKA70DRAFT_1225120 [Coprinopsis sp. MPI-PUGE-AT-0042]|nr:hypothetical protein BKA70DRAFT_1225120 [Coprinopsis sp. MPI-PUGE-AT-0042]